MSDNFGAPLDPSVIKSDEKLMALFSHISFVLGVSIILPLIFWAISRDKSKFVTFHALQSLFFHIAYVVLIIIMAIVLVFGGIGFGLLTSGAGSKTLPVISIIAIIAFYVFMFLYLIGGVIYSIFMGIKAYEGKMNMYPVVGKLVYKQVYEK